MTTMIRLPLEDKTGSAGFEFQMKLSGDMFNLEFRYNDRDERYYLTIRDEDNAVIAGSVKVVKGAPLLKNITSQNRPWGDFIVEDVGANAEPTITNLGDGIDILYLSFFEI